MASENSNPVSRNKRGFGFVRAAGVAAIVLGVSAATVGVAALTASAATQTVTITAHGYVPNSSSIAVGDSVTVVNGDIVVHQIVFSVKTGVTCTPNPLVLQPGTSGSCTFQSSGTYSYSDPNIKGKTFKGTVVVAKAPPSPSVALAISPGVVMYRHTETLSGTVSDHSSGQTVQIFAQSCGQTTAMLNGSATTTAGGAFSALRQPLNNTTYSVKVEGGTSNSVLAGVFPRQQLRKTSLHHFSILVRAATSLAGKYVTFQRYSSSLRRWVNVKTVTLRRNLSGVAPTVVSSAAFTSNIVRPQRVRTVLSKLQVGACYLPGYSNVIYN